MAATRIRTSAAAELLGVSPSTLRSWERRLAFPRPHRTPGNHRLYDLAEIEALREALSETGNISSAVSIARQRGRGPSSPARLLRAIDRFDETAADREMEESLALRSLERSVEELMLVALEMAADRAGTEAELEFACRWAIGWLHSARRLSPPASRDEGVLLLDSGSALGVEAVHVQALELFVRRAGLRCLLLSADLAERRFATALRALQPRAVVLCGEAASLEVLGPTLRRVMRSGEGIAVCGFRAARLVAGRDGTTQLGPAPGEATRALIQAVEAPAAQAPPDLAELRRRAS